MDEFIRASSDGDREAAGTPPESIFLFFSDAISGEIFPNLRFENACGLIERETERREEMVL